MLKCEQYSELTYKIIGAAMEVHNELSFGLLEAIYQESLQLELQSRGIECEREKEIETYYKKQLLQKKYRMDLMVGDIILELKSAYQILPVHRAQLCNYLRLTRKPLGLLINFGEKSLVGERWAYDEEINQCILVDRHMQPVFDADYSKLLSGICQDDDNDILKTYIEKISKK